MLDIRSESGQAQLKAPMMQSKFIENRMEILTQRIYFFNDTKKELVAHKNRKNVLALLFNCETCGNTFTSNRDFKQHKSNQINTYNQNPIKHI